MTKQYQFPKQDTAWGVAHVVRFSNENQAALRQHASLSTDQLLGAILAEIHGFVAEPKFTDDICLLGMDVKRVGL
ncbi:MAG: hypothetical protein WCG79_05160 [Verrucomicrobiota bacterium]